MQAFTERMAPRARGKQPSPIREFLPLMGLPDMISLGGGYPNPETFAFAEAALRFVDGSTITLERAHLQKISQYGPSDGQVELKQVLKSWQTHKDGLAMGDLDLCVLNGSQEGLFIAAYLLLATDDCVLVSEPTYPGAISAFSSFCRNFLTVPLDRDGIDTGAMEALLADRVAKGLKLPKFIYTIPNGHNPGGVSLPLVRRQEMLAIATKYDLLILEDDPYQLVAMDPDAKRLPTLQSLDREGRVIRLDSFSKIFAPGLRVGYVSGEPEALRHYVLFKQSSNLHTSPFIQGILAAYLQSVGNAGFLTGIAKNCQTYRANLEAMLAAAAEFLPATVRYNPPTSGMFVWFQLPETIDAAGLLKKWCTTEKVILIPGSAFSTTGGLGNFMRASYGTVTPDRITEGIERFARLLAR